MASRPVKSFPSSSKKKDRKDSYDFASLTADRATRRVLAPYVRIIRRGQKVTTGRHEHAVSEYVKKKPVTLLKNLADLLVDRAELSSLLHETADVLKAATASAGVVVYTVDNLANEIVQCPRLPNTEHHRVNWKIGPGSTVAAYVASIKEYLLVDDFLKDSRFPMAGGWMDPMVKSVLCVPVVTPEDECIAVVELYKTVKDGGYTKVDVQLVIAMSTWIGACIHQNLQRLHLQRQQELNDYLLHLISCYCADTVVTDKILSDIVAFAKETVSAERGSFFIIDPECDELVADLYEEGIEDPEVEPTLYKKKLKIRFSRDRGIAGLVARTGQTINVKDVYNDPRFNKEVDTETGLITRSLLCMPIMGHNGLLGVVQLVNKKEGAYFSRTDERILKSFSVYCAIALHYAQLQDRLRKVEYQNTVKTDMLKFHMQPCSHDMEDLLAEPLLDKMPEGFTSFHWYCTGLEPQLPRLTLLMLAELVEDCQARLPQWLQFVLMVRKAYRGNPYHNYVHAFTVCHCMYNMLRRNVHAFSSIEIKGLMVASLCHDLDHRGVTNSFYQMTGDSLAELYPDSPLENHHFQVAMLIINGCNIFESFGRQAFKELTQQIHDAILATDLAFYFRCRFRLLAILDEDRLNLSESSHRMLLKSIMMTTSDLSGLCKPFAVAKHISEHVYQEFYRQGDTEKDMGIFPLSMMDRDKQHMIPDDQINFISVVCLPCISLLVQILPNTEPLLEQCTKLREGWKEIKELKGVKVWRPEDSVNLK